MDHRLPLIILHYHNMDTALAACLFHCIYLAKKSEVSKKKKGMLKIETKNKRNRTEKKKHEKRVGKGRK